MEKFRPTTHKEKLEKYGAIDMDDAKAKYNLEMSYASKRTTILLINEQIEDLATIGFLQKRNKILKASQNGHLGV